MHQKTEIPWSTVLVSRVVKMAAVRRQFLQPVRCADIFYIEISGLEQPLFTPLKMSAPGGNETPSLRTHARDVHHADPQGRGHW